MKTIEAYQSADGALYLDAAKARARDDDLLGEALDGLFALFELDVSRSQQYKALLCAMKKRPALRAAMLEALRVLDHADSDTEMLG